MAPRTDKTVDETVGNVLQRFLDGKPTREDVAKVILAMGKDIANKTSRTSAQYKADLKTIMDQLS